MRIFEIADAEAQLALWKLVNDSVWTAIQTQQHEQAKHKAAAAQQQKKAKRSTKRISKRSMSVPLPPPKVPMPTTKPKQPPIQKAATPTQQNANPHLNPQAKVPYSAQPPTTAATPNVKVANVAKQVSDVDDNEAALAQPTQSQRVPTLPTKNALLAQKKGITAFKRA